MKILSLSLSILVLLSIAAIAQPRVEAEQPLTRAVRDAQALVDQGLYGRAINQLEAALDSAAPGESREDALELLAHANFESARYRDALIASRRYLSIAPFTPELAGIVSRGRALNVLYIRGVSAYEERLVDEAERSFRTVAEHGAPMRYYRTLDANYWLARIFADRGRLDSAETYAQNAILDPNDPFTGGFANTIHYSYEFSDDALYLIGWIREGRDEIDSAAGLYRRIVNEYPGSDVALDAQLRLGVIEARRGQYESAITLLNSLTPRSTRQREEQLFYLAEASAALGRHEDALRYHTQFLREYPASRRVRLVRYGVGWSQLQLQRWDEAITTFRQLESDIDSIAAAASYQVGAIQTLRGDTAGALRTLHSLVYRLPYESFSDNAYYQIGRIHYRQRNYDSARHYLQIPARQFPESDIRTDAYYLLAESYVGLGHYDNAQYNFMRTRKVGATGDLYRRSLYREGVMLYKLGRFASAIDRLREYVAEHPEGKEIDEATFWLGEALYQDRSYNEAERYFAALVERFPESRWREQAVYGLAWARFQQKDFKGAARTFDEFIKGYPESDYLVEATIRLADSYRFLREYDRAIATYETIGGSAGKSERAEEARFRLADALFEMGEVDRAVSTYRALLQWYPKSERRDIYAYNIGRIYREKERDSAAIEEMKRFIVDYERSRLLPQAYFTIGDAYYNMAQYDSAYTYYYAVLDRYPNSTIVPEALDAVRFSLDALGRGRDALAVIDSFMARNPNRLPADSLVFSKAGISFDQGEYAEAIGFYRDLLKDYPESELTPEALYQIGRSYSYLGNQDSALILFTDVVNRFPGSTSAPKALIDQGGLRLAASNWQGAITDFDLFIRRYTESNRMNEARFGLGRAMLAVADTAGALTQFRTIVDSSGTDDDDIFIDRSRIAMARIFERQGRRDEAIELLAAVVARRLDDIAAEALLFRGSLLMAANDLSGALAELRRLTADFTSYPEYAEPGMLLLGTVYEQLTNYAAAREVYTQLIAQTEDPALKGDAEARLKKLKK